MLRIPARRLHKEESGLTMIELLVVILIIGILAAIAMPAFLGQRGRAQDATAKSAVRTAAEAMEAYYVDAQTFVGANATRLKGIEPSLNQANGFAVKSAGATTYSVSVTSKSPAATKYFMTRSAAGVVTRTCDDAGVNGCSKAKTW
jgi:type IV pilus assembly protein PilA